MKPRILLVNPPIYDFSAYDFWLKPYGLLQVGGFLRHKAELRLFDHLDRLHPLIPVHERPRSDRWGRGKFISEAAPKPPEYSNLWRRYRRFGIPRHRFQRFLEEEGPFDYALVQTVMTYWYPGVAEVVEDIRVHSPRARVVLGGVYATLLPQHAGKLGADLVVEGADLEPLWRFFGFEPDSDGLPFWEGYENLEVGVLKLSDGCPLSCTYCAVPQLYPPFRERPVGRALRELDLLVARGVRNVAFYDDALLYRKGRTLVPFLRAFLDRGVDAHFHTPNALNARLVTTEVARLMVQAGFKTFYLGLESTSPEWQRRTGGKIHDVEFARAVESLVRAGADPGRIVAYVILAHPEETGEEVEASLHFAHRLGIRAMLSEFSPIPGTPDALRCRSLVDLEEPLWHNKTVFPLVALGAPEVNRLKAITRRLNAGLEEVLDSRARREKRRPLGT